MQLHNKVHNDQWALIQKLATVNGWTDELIEMAVRNAEASGAVRALRNAAQEIRSHEVEPGLPAQLQEGSAQYLDALAQFEEEARA